jgi:hypothetical protein
MFVFLPVMAFVMLLVYWWPRHYYVEHLVFFLHLHAAMFLILILELLLSRAIGWLPALATVGGFAKAAGFFYALWYVYRALRNYYGQKRWLTLTKFMVVGFAYMVLLSITLVSTLIFSALNA